MPWCGVSEKILSLDGVSQIPFGNIFGSFERQETSRRNLQRSLQTLQDLRPGSDAASCTCRWMSTTFKRSFMHYGVRVGVVKQRTALIAGDTSARAQRSHGSITSIR